MTKTIADAVPQEIERRRVYPLGARMSSANRNQLARNLSKRSGPAIAALALSGAVAAMMVAPVSSAATDPPPRPAKVMSATGSTVGPEKCLERSDTERKTTQCYRMSRTVLTGDSIKIEGTRWWPHPQTEDVEPYDVEIRLSVLENSAGNSTHDDPVKTPIFKKGTSSDAPYATIKPDYFDRSWSVTLPLPNSETAQAEDGRDVDSLIRPGAIIGVDIVRNETDRETGNRRDYDERNDWLSVTRPARSGEYAPRVTEQPKSQAWGSSYDEVLYFDARAKANPKARALFEGSAYRTPEYGYSEPEGLWLMRSPLTNTTASGVATMTETQHTIDDGPWDGGFYDDAPPRARAAFVNEVGNTVTAGANIGSAPATVNTGSEALVKDSRLMNYFYSPTKAKRGQTITISTGADRPGHTFGARIYRGEGHRSFGWKTTDKAGKFKVKIPKNLKPGRLKLALYDATGELYGWNYINVTK